MPGDGPPITLYRLQACPYCERVVRRLKELELDYASRFVEPFHSERDVVKRLTGKRYRHLWTDTPGSRCPRAPTS